ncbi:hypothetical protein [Actibacterium sp.]|uniref:hypothetical protein n=1 Tax=Actibacterium sp. TaxID=1872125 RepID=UPI0035658F86
MPRLYVVDVPEFRSIVEVAAARADYHVHPARKGYWLIETSGALEFNRRDLKLKPALWYGMFTGGMDGEIAHWDRDDVRIIGTNKPL